MWLMRSAWMANRTKFGTNSPMTTDLDENAETAMQYLQWALEGIEKVGNQKAARHVRIALDALRKTHRSEKTERRAI